jgi:hypothetical protein
MFEEKLGGKRGRERPRLRCIDDVEEELRDMGVKHGESERWIELNGICYKGSQGQTETAVLL